MLGECFEEVEVGGVVEVEDEGGIFFGEGVELI